MSANFLLTFLQRGIKLWLCAGDNPAGTDISSVKKRSKRRKGNKVKEEKEQEDEDLKQTQKEEKKENEEIEEIEEEEKLAYDKVKQLLKKQFAASKDGILYLYDTDFKELLEAIREDAADKEDRNRQMQTGANLDVWVWRTEFSCQRNSDKNGNKNECQVV